MRKRELPRPPIQKTHPKSNEQHEHNRENEGNAYRSGNICYNLHQSKLQRVEVLRVCPHVKEFVTCVEVCLESVLWFQNLRRDNVGAPDVSTHSVGDGTDSIVKLRTICGNLENTF